MNITSQQIIQFYHHHTPEGYPVHLIEKIPTVIQNPLHRSCCEKFLSYLPLFSTYIGFRTLLRISSLEESLEIRVGISKICSLSPCLEMNSAIASIRRNAWLELLGIKSLFAIFHVVIRVIRFFLSYCKQLKTPFVQISTKSPQEEIIDLIS
ncbi:hypothetical protein BOKEGFJH_00427 [Chlamydia avium]|uniref:Uncharacterized protein n=1 Tax=Chlamydia avium TaxID=1457141 RepID=A0ABP2X5B8_9CHLA|nr:hypothetical protein [Chlamydia avium]EPP37373.1 hypothetical protein CP10743SC13_0769 [Chlamydia psittaci 10_743_SC13]EPP38008.1 hypothetical protein CP10881SC42_0851 [Chlamydia avium]VVT42904.1 hypothetical protein BOKEGFJH_00427 [Chlamydia avium]